MHCSNEIRREQAKHFAVNGWWPFVPPSAHCTIYTKAKFKKRHITNSQCCSLSFASHGNPFCDYLTFSVVSSSVRCYCCCSKEMIFMQRLASTLLLNARFILFLLTISDVEISFRLRLVTVFSIKTHKHIVPLCMHDKD